MIYNVTNNKDELLASIDSANGEVIEKDNIHIVTAEEDSRFNTQEYCEECAETACDTADFYLRKADELLKAGSINLTQREVLVTLGHQYQVTAGLFLTLAHLAEVEK